CLVNFFRLRGTKLTRRGVAAGGAPPALGRPRVAAGGAPPAPGRPRAAAGGALPRPGGQQAARRPHVAVPHQATTNRASTSAHCIIEESETRSSMPWIDSARGP